MKKIDERKLKLLKESLEKTKLVLAALKKKENEEKEKEENTPIVNLVKGLETISPTQKEWKNNVITECDKETFQWFLKNKDRLNMEVLIDIEKALYPAYQIYRRVESFIKRYKDK